MHTEKDNLKARVAKMLPACVENDLTIVVDDTIIFLTNVFKDGAVLGFWSHSPWGRVHNQEMGWMVVSSTGENVDSIATKSFLGADPDTDFKTWRKNVTETYGPSKRLCDEFTLENIWRLSDT